MMRAKPIGQLLRESASSAADAEFIIQDHRRVTFGEMDRLVDLLAAHLLERGLQKGDPVALWQPNSVEWAVAALAVFRIGAVLVPLNTRYTMRETLQILAQSEAKALFLPETWWSNDYLAMALEMVPELAMTAGNRLEPARLPHLREIVLTRGDARGLTVSPLAEILAQDTTRFDAVEEAAAQVTVEDTAVVVYTSGTTGAPKGAMHSHELVRNCLNIARELHIEPGDGILGHMPLYHVAGFCTAFIPAILLGCPYYAMPQWHPDRALDLIESERIRIFGGIPTHFIDLVDAIRRSPRDTSCLKSAWIGGANVTLELAQTARTVLQFDALQAVYGMTETTSSTTLTPFDDPIEVTGENRGKPIGDFEVGIFDPSTYQAMPTGSQGEVWIRGHIVMQGYYKNPDATTAVIAPGGWFKTGDLGVFDAAGYLSIVGRVKDMFIVGGSNVYPAEIESVIAAIPGVRQAVVVGMPDARLGEVGCAFIQLHEGSALSGEDIQQICKESLASYKVPQQVRLIEEFPLTPTGKIMRHVIIDRARAESSA
jgi:fatty-acyl-CoA synthase